MINNIKNAQSLNVANTKFNVDIEHPDHGWIPYTLDPDDNDNHINNSELIALIGRKFKAYVAPTAKEIHDEAAAEVRAVRNQKLIEDVDVIVTNPLRWADLSKTQQNKLIAYRQALLDITKQSTFPQSVKWPKKP